MNVDCGSKSNLNWPVALFISAVLHIIVLGALVLCSDSSKGGAESEIPQETDGPLKGNDGTDEDKTEGSDVSSHANVPISAGDSSENTGSAAITPSPRESARSTAVSTVQSAPSESAASTLTHADARASSSQPSASATKVYTVKSGDSLTRISKKFKCTVTEIAKLNNIKANSGLRIGQKLKVPIPIE